jgi:hypothetical protein
MVLYFAYGSNMNQQDLDNYCKRKGRPLIDLKSKSPRVCILEDYRLIFNYYSLSRMGGAANIEPAQGDYVEGVLFNINDIDKQTIDNKEGAPRFYYEITVPVILKDGTKVKNVTTYAACENRKTVFTAPTQEYIEVMIEGARAFGLSDLWINRIIKIAKNDRSSSS